MTIEEMERLYAEAALGPCAVHPAIARIDEMTEDGPDPVLALAFPHDRRSEDQTFAIGRLVCVGITTKQSRRAGEGRSK